MVGVLTLWPAILAAAVLVFVASSVVHMLLPYHRNDFRRLPREDEIREALRPFAIPPGDYVTPHSGGDLAAMKSDEYRAEVERGPVAFMTVLRGDKVFSMGGRLTQWFLYCVLVSVFAAYLTGRAMGTDADYLEVFRFAATTAFAGYALGVVPQSIWYSQAWSTTLKNVFDGLVYALLTGGAFGWLWPA